MKLKDIKFVSAPPFLVINLVGANIISETNFFAYMIERTVEYEKYKEYKVKEIRWYFSPMVIELEKDET